MGFMAVGFHGFKCSSGYDEPHPSVLGLGV